MPFHWSRPSGHTDLSRQCRRPRESADGPRTLTAHALSWWLLDALCGGVGMPEAWGDPSASSCSWISGYSSTTALLIQDRRKNTGPSECEGTTAWNLSGQTGPVSLQVHQQRHRQPATGVRGASVLLFIRDRRADRALSNYPDPQRERSGIETLLPHVQRHAPSGWRLLHGQALDRRGRDIRMDIRL